MDGAKWLCERAADRGKKMEFLGCASVVILNRHKLRKVRPIFEGVGWNYKCMNGGL